MKRIMCIMLVIVLGLSLPLTVFATTSEFESVDDFAIRQMTRYINASYSGSNVVTISEAMEIFDYDTNAYLSSAYFAISDDNIVGMLIVTGHRNEYVSSYILEPYSEILHAYKSGLAFALISYSGELIIKINDDLSILTSNANNVDLSAYELTNLSIEATKIINTESRITIFPQSRSTIMIRIYDVPYVANISVNGAGLCWAATVASMSNYYKNTSYSALDVYNICSNNYSGTPAGNDYWYNMAYSLLDMTISIDSSSSASLTYNQIYGNLVTYGPIQIGLRRTDSLGNTHGHAIVISGIQVFQDTAYNPSNYYSIYYIRDSNNESEVCYIVDYDAMTDGDLFEYIPPYDTSRCYDTWTRTIIVTDY